jgi:hypothetical protein
VKPGVKWILTRSGTWNYAVPRSGCREGFVLREPWSGFYVAHVFGNPETAFLSRFADAKRFVVERAR